MYEEGGWMNDGSFETGQGSDMNFVDGNSGLNTESDECFITAVEGNQAKNTEKNTELKDSETGQAEKTRQRQVSFAEQSLSVSVSAGMEEEKDEEMAQPQAEARVTANVEGDGRGDSLLPSPSPSMHTESGVNASLPERDLATPTQIQSGAGGNPVATTATPTAVLQQAHTPNNLPSSASQLPTLDSRPTSRPIESQAVLTETEVGLATSLADNTASAASQEESESGEVLCEEGRKEREEQNVFDQSLPTQPSQFQAGGSGEEGGKAIQKESVKSGIARWSMGGKGDIGKTVAGKLAAMRTSEGRGGDRGRGQRKEVIKTRSKTGRK